MIIEWLFTFLVLYLLYKLVFNFIVPVYKTSSEIRNKFDEMNQQQQQYRQQKPPSPSPEQQQSKSKPPAEDYIDFEEIK
jgi:hypothetical protein